MANPLPARSSSTFHTSHYFNPTSIVYALAFASAEGAQDLLAIGGESQVDILRRDTSEVLPQYKLFKSFQLGFRATAITWSPRAYSPTDIHSDYLIELAVSCIDNRLRILTASSEVPKADVFTFGEGAGHRARINDICFCSSVGADGYLASVGDDKLCIIWDLSPGFSDETDAAASMSGRPPPYPLLIPHSHPVCSVSYNPMRASHVLTCTSAGQLTLIAWSLEDNLQYEKVVELYEPRRLVSTLSGKKQGFAPAGGDCKPDDPNMFGAILGNKWHIWDLTRISGGRPIESGNAHPQSGHRFKWCPTNPSLFATVSYEPSLDEVVKIYNINFPQSPTPIILDPQYRDRVRAFDWSSEGEWIAVAVGQKVIFAPIRDAPQ